ncbi:MAG: hypothetical protein E5Y02_10445 [Mesorhizobium sp.]|nr:MAG: hypothetical protein E5Y02_10445 [Mesorhizobium sp.]
MRLIKTVREGEVQNDVPAPSMTSVGRELWTIFERCHFNPNLDIKTLTKRYNPGNVRTEMSLWRKFHGLA